MKIKTLSVPPALQNDVACIRLAEYSGEQPFSINVCMNGLPGIVFQHHDGHSPVERIATPSRSQDSVPTLYVYGQTTEPGVMHHKPTPFTMTQIILKPHALRTLFGVNAVTMTSRLVELNEFAIEDLNLRLLEARDDQQRVNLLTNFLLARREQVNTRDHLIEESLRLIHHNVGSLTVRMLLDHLSLSERQFEKRFRQTVGIAPQFYIRIKRFNEVIRLMKAQKFTRLTDVAYSLTFYDQSHFIRDIKAFSGTTPRRLFQKADAIELEHHVYAFT